jgi:hypothetical protein
MKMIFRLSFLQNLFSVKWSEYNIYIWIRANVLVAWCLPYWQVYIFISTFLFFKDWNYYKRDNTFPELSTKYEDIILCTQSSFYVMKTRTFQSWTYTSLSANIFIFGWQINGTLVCISHLRIFWKYTTCFLSKKWT